MKKLYNITMSFVLIMGILCSSYIASSCFQDKNNANIYSNKPTGATAVDMPPNATIQDYANEYLECMVTVGIYKQNSMVGHGSGVAIADGGFIATNYHVVSLAVTSSLTYTLKLDVYNGSEIETEIPATIIWYDADLDLAIIRSDDNMPYVKMADRWIEPSTSSLKFVENLWTLGTPLETSLFGTFSSGVLNNKFKQIGITSVDSIYYVHETLITHSAPISSGNSGGGLFDANGNLVGLNTMLLVSSYDASTSSWNSIANGIYFAVPIYPLTLIIDEIYEKETHDSASYSAPSLQLEVIDKNYYGIGSCLYTGDNLYVNAVTKKNATHLGGIKAGNIIVGMGNSTCSGTSDSSYVSLKQKYDLEYNLLKYKSGENIKLFYKVNEDGEINSTTITV